MNEDLDKVISDINSKVKNHQKKFIEYLKIVKSKGNTLVDYSKIKFEIKKCKYELKKDYLNIGKYVSKKYDSNNTVDFSYDENLKHLLEKVKNLKSYILKLEENI